MAYTTGGDPYWAIWAGSSTTTTTTTISTWTSWCSEGTGSTTVSSTASAAWVSWNSTNSTSASIIYEPPQTAEERAEREARWEARVAEQARLRKEADARRKDAEARAEALLVENLSLKQRAEYEAHKHFFVESRRGRRFRVRRGRSGNVDVIGEDGRITLRLCAHPEEAVPDQDTMLAQKLMLEDDCETFMRLANKTVQNNGEQVLPRLH